MEYLYLTKDVGPVPKGSVERFAPPIAARLLLDGTAERFDQRKHGSKPGAPRLARIDPIKGRVEKD